MKLKKGKLVYEPGDKVVVLRSGNDINERIIGQVAEIQRDADDSTEEVGHRWHLKYPAPEQGWYAGEKQFRPATADEIKAAFPESPEPKEPTLPCVECQKPVDSKTALCRDCNDRIGCGVPVVPDEVLDEIDNSESLIKKLLNVSGEQSWEIASALMSEFLGIRNWVHSLTPGPAPAEATERKSAPETFGPSDLEVPEVNAELLEEIEVARGAIRSIMSDDEIRKPRTLTLLHEASQSLNRAASRVNGGAR